MFPWFMDGLAHLPYWWIVWLPQSNPVLGYKVQITRLEGKFAEQMYGTSIIENQYLLVLLVVGCNGNMHKKTPHKCDTHLTQLEKATTPKTPVPF